jgi:uncharacterized protein YmfQ (DUF2313 family)
MTAPLFSRVDYRRALQRLLPRGRAWPRDEDSVQVRVLDGLAGSLAALDASAQFLLADSFPAQAVSLLPDWEATLGLPDPCSGDTPSIPARQGQVVARLADNGGASVLDLTAYAARLGFTITIQTFSPFRMGVSGMGTGIYVEAAAHAFAVQAPETTVTPFQMGLSGMGDPFQGFGNDVLECEISALAPAHTTVIYQYGA